MSQGNIYKNMDKFLQLKAPETSNNLLQTITLPVCPLGQERSRFTGRCIKSPKKGQARNPLTNRLYFTD